MGYDLAIVVPPVADYDVDAWQDLDGLIDQQGRAPEVFRTCHDRLVARYPCLMSIPEDRLDDEGVWKDAPLWNNFGFRAAVVGLTFPRVREVLPFVIETATALGLTVFDWTTKLVHRPNGFKGLRLTLENRAVLHAPTLPQIRSAVDALTPQGGPGSLILEGPGADYTQAAGGEGAYTAEWREYRGERFRHFVAGIPGQPAKKYVAIETNGFQITVKENERLEAVEVKAILTAFAERSDRPENFIWRDITEQFA